MFCIFNQEIEDKLRFGNKKKQAFFVLHSTCIIFIQKKNEDKLRFGNKKKQAFFVLHSTCIIFVPHFKNNFR